MINNPRIDLMRRDTKDFDRIVNVLGWELTELRSDGAHSYLVYKVEKNAVSHKFARLYSQSTDRAVYKALENEVECIFINGIGFDTENSFSKNCSIPVIPEAEFLYVMTDWNMEFLGIPLDEAVVSVENSTGQAIEPASEGVVTKRSAGGSKSDVIHIIEENPLEQIYTQLRALTSKTVARKAVELHACKQKIELDEDDIIRKAEGVSYLVQNAIDYYDSASTENMTQRMLNLYYGTIALMEAEMLISGDQYKELSEIENVTKNGHGMLTFGDAQSGLGDFYVGVLNKGLFQAWLSHRNVDVTHFPDSKKKAQSSEWHISLNKLLYCIPELENILLEVDEDYGPGYLFPSYDSIFNHTRGLSKETYYQRKYHGSYVDMIDMTGKADVNLVKELPGKITMIGPYEDSISGSGGWRVYVQHKKDGKHFEEYKTHKGLSASMILKPLFGITNDWEVYAVMILYALSIIVRYMPNLWARISHGDLDRYKAVFYQFSRVAERELTQVFLEKLTGKRVVIRHPQGLI